jgi:hypothetical protein
VLDGFAMRDGLARPGARRCQFWCSIIPLQKAWNQAYKLGDRQALDTILDDQIVLING